MSVHIEHAILPILRSLLFFRVRVWYFLHYYHIRKTNCSSDSVAVYRRLFPSPEDIHKSAAAFIEKQDEEVKEVWEPISVSFFQWMTFVFLQAKRAAKRKFTEPDEEGWITVTKAAKKVCDVTFLFINVCTPWKCLHKFTESNFLSR